MKVVSVSKKNVPHPIKVLDCRVGKGYLQGAGGGLPDVDVDYQSDKRHLIKEYMETRYNLNGKQRVFSAGTYTTLKIKAAIKDVARTMRIPVSLVNYITGILEDDKCDFTGIFKLAYSNKKVAKFIADYPMLFEDLRPLLFQPRSASMHASALIVTPDEKDGEPMECFDFVPIKKVDGVLVSENDGVEIDEMGLLKNDCLATKELSKLQAIMDICNKEYGANITLQSIAESDLNDAKAYQLVSQGFTQNVFQLSSKGMTKFLMSMQPSSIHDLIAANALYRPATLDNGSTESYVDCKMGLVAPVYMWGTYDALKDTYGLITYQEQVVLIARTVGGFSLGDGVKLVKLISKKQTEKIQAMRSKFMDGAKKNGCPKDDAIAIWEQIEACGSYLFNKSHATAYAVTSYVGAYLKANYPTAFYTVALQWADDANLPSLMSEMELCSQAKVVAPDINKSGDMFFTDYTTDSIFWSISRIKMVGVKAVDWIMSERDKNDDFTSLNNFIHRIFKYKLKKYEYWDDPDNEEEAVRCPVNARHVINLIFAGCFDKLEGIQNVTERYRVLQKASEMLGCAITEKDVPSSLINKEYFWSQQQIKVSGMGSVDYRKAYDQSSAKQKIRSSAGYCSLDTIKEYTSDGKRVAVCATVVQIEERQFTSKKTGQEETFCKIVLQQNNELCECIAWAEEYAEWKKEIQSSLNKMIVLSGTVKWSDFAQTNNIQLTKRTKIEVL